MWTSTSRAHRRPPGPNSRRYSPRSLQQRHEPSGRRRGAVAWASRGDPPRRRGDAGVYVDGVRALLGNATGPVDILFMTEDRAALDAFRHAAPAQAPGALGGGPDRGGRRLPLLLRRTGALLPCAPQGPAGVRCGLPRHYGSLEPLSGRDFIPELLALASLVQAWLVHSSATQFAGVGTLNNIFVSCQRLFKNNPKSVLAPPVPGYLGQNFGSPKFHT